MLYKNLSVGKMGNANGNRSSSSSKLSAKSKTKLKYDCRSSNKGNYDKKDCYIDLLIDINWFVYEFLLDLTYYTVLSKLVRLSICSCVSRGIPTEADGYSNSVLILWKSRELLRLSDRKPSLEYQRHVFGSCVSMF